MTSRLLFYHLRPSYISSVYGNALCKHTRHLMTAEVFGTIQPQCYLTFNLYVFFALLTMDECYDTPFIRSHRVSLAHKAKLWPKMYGIEYQFIENQGLVCQLGDFQTNGQHHQNHQSLHTRGFYTMGDLEKIGNT